MAGLLACAAMTAVGCTPVTVGGPAPTGSVSQETAAGVIQQTQSVAVQVCGFLPAVETVAQLITAFSGGGQAVASAANVGRAICDAVTGPKKAGRGSGGIKVQGVPIRGQFVGKS